MRKLLVLLICLLCGAITVSAQECGQGLPCGPVPWKLPALPTLPSPSPMPTYQTTVEATHVSGAVPTPAAMPTNPPLLDVDTSDIGDQMSTLAALIEATPELVLNAEGTAEAIGTAELTGAETLFAYAKGVGSINLGNNIGPLVAFSLTAMVLIITTKMTTFLLPVLTALFGIIRKIVQLILDFLPFSILVLPFQDGTLTPWPTPTPRTFAEATPAFNIPTGMPYAVAEEVVQGYHFANQDGALDTIVVIAILVLVIGGMWTIVSKVKEL